MPFDPAYDHTVTRRSDGTRQDLRPTQPWPQEKPFKILSIDGGGILGLLPCLILAEIESRVLDGEPIGQHFDMIVGTSTGGIIALGLVRLDAPQVAKRVAMDDVERAVTEMPPIARSLTEGAGHRIQEIFLQNSGILQKVIG